MPKYVIERNMPGAGSMATDELMKIAEKSCAALEEIGAGIQWVESFVTADRVYSVYIARNERMIREHAYLTGMPADKICEVIAVVDPNMALEARRAKHQDAAKESGIY